MLSTATIRPRGSPAQSQTCADKSPKWVKRPVVTNGKKEYQYIPSLHFKPGCLMDCHGQRTTRLDHIDNLRLMRLSPDGQHWVKTKEGDLAGAVVLNLPMDQTTKAINKNRATLIVAALITAIVAMLSSYTMVRYVIVKPVKHLRDVSDAIAGGRLTIRSQIETGDEFEELSHAFNRMLHNLVAMQQERCARSTTTSTARLDELARRPTWRLFENEPAQERLPAATMSHELRTPLNSIIWLLRGALRQRSAQRAAPPLLQQHPVLG